MTVPSSVIWDYISPISPLSRHISPGTLVGHLGRQRDGDRFAAHHLVRVRVRVRARVRVRVRVGLGLGLG